MNFSPFHLVAVALFFTIASSPTQAAETGSYKAAIWVDPDGCEHWVLDLGIEGMMSPHLDREGRPVCGRPTNVCMEFPDDMLFGIDEATLSSQSVGFLTRYFTKEIQDGRGNFVIVGHTDNTGSEVHNQALSLGRATAVAGVARQVGGIVQINAQGEAQPIADNSTLDGRRRNRRVEILCE